MSAGSVRRDLGDLDGAIADYARAIELNPKSAPAYVDRGNAKRDQGNFDAALADYNRAIEIDHENYFAFLGSGITKTIHRDFEGALKELLQASEFASGGRVKDYTQFYVWSVRVRLGQGDEANKMLIDYLGNRNDPPVEPWVSEFGQFLQGKLTENDLIASASATDPVRKQEQLCECWYYTGMKRLFAGDKGTAKDGFNKCVATKRVRFIEYELAKAELASLSNVSLRPDSSTPARQSSPKSFLP